jgi:hypothetical protein
MREPTFVIAGGQRCRTTWLVHLLDEHPDVYMAKPVHPEPKFFLSEPAPGKDAGWYVRTWFAAATTEAAVGEKSTSYMDAPDVPRRMREAFPRLQVVFVLRNPVDRAVSNYRFSRYHGLEKAPLDVALREEERRVRETSFPGVSTHPFAYVRRGRYAEHIDRFLEHFAPEALKIVLEDDLAAEPVATYRSLFAFLGVDPDFTPASATRRENPSPSDDLTLAPATFDYLLEQFEESTRRLAGLLGRDLGAWRRPSPMIAAMLRAGARRRA